MIFTFLQGAASSFRSRLAPLLLSTNFVGCPDRVHLMRGGREGR
jgi:hypothetical protein